MTINQLVKELCKREGLKKQVDIAQIREIIGHLSDLLFDEMDNVNPKESIACLLIRNGQKRKKKK